VVERSRLMNCIVKGKENLSVFPEALRELPPPFDTPSTLTRHYEPHLAAKEGEPAGEQLDPGAKIRAELQGEHQ
jgi:hypothetical protein